MNWSVLKAALAVTAHFGFWAATAEDADATVLRWRTNGTHCKPQESVQFPFIAAQNFAGMEFFDQIDGNGIGPKATCFVPLGTDLMMLAAGARQVETVSMRMERLGPSEWFDLYLTSANYVNPGAICTCDHDQYASIPNTFTVSLSYGPCANNPQCGTSWGLGVDINMTDFSSGGLNSFKVRLMSAYSVN